MYNLGEQFKIDYTKARANKGNIVKGEKYRFTLLSPRLIRLEYNEQGDFLDKPTQFALHRFFPSFEFKSQDSSRSIEISTDYFKLTYIKNKPFEGIKVNPGTNLKIELLKTNKVWYYGHPEVRNLKAPSGNLEEEILAGKGLYSEDGFASFDDSYNLVFNEDGTAEERKDESSESGRLEESVVRC